MQWTSSELAVKLGGQLIGEENKQFTQLARIEDAKESDISFIANPKYEKYASECKAGLLIVSKAFDSPVPAHTSLLKVEDPYQSFAFLLRELAESALDKSGFESPLFLDPSAEYSEAQYIGAFSYIGKNVKIAKGCKIYPHTYIGDNVEIGENTVLYAGVKLYAFSKVGKNCVIHSGAVIGSDGFGFAPNAQGVFEKIPQLGNVVLEDHVEIGANSCIDRATLGSTFIRKGVKLDNMVQIAHNVEIGSNTVMAAQVGVSGSTKIGAQCMVGGQAGFAGHLEIAAGNKINAQSGVARSIKQSGKAWNGSPATEYTQSMKSAAALKTLPETQRRLIALERAFEKIKYK